MLRQNPNQTVTTNICSWMMPPCSLKAEFIHPFQKLPSQNKPPKPHYTAKQHSQTIIQQTDGDYAFFMLKERLDCGGKRSNRRSTAIFWRKQGHRRFRHKPNSPLETWNRKPDRLFRLETWRLSIKKASNSNPSKP